MLPVFASCCRLLRPPAWRSSPSLLPIARGAASRGWSCLALRSALRPPSQLATLLRRPAPCGAPPIWSFSRGVKTSGKRLTRRARLIRRAKQYARQGLFKRAERGLYGGKVRVFGQTTTYKKNKVHGLRVRRRLRRSWKPNARNLTFQSETLQKPLRFKMTMYVKRQIVKLKHGIDEYLMTEDKPLIRNPQALRLRKYLLYKHKLRARSQDKWIRRSANGVAEVAPAAVTRPNLPDLPPPDLPDVRDFSVSEASEGPGACDVPASEEPLLSSTVHDSPSSPHEWVYRERKDPNYNWIWAKLRRHGRKAYKNYGTKSPAKMACDARRAVRKRERKTAKRIKLGMQETRERAKDIQQERAYALRREHARQMVQ